MNILESGLINKKESPCPAGLEFFIKNIHIYTGAMGAPKFKYNFKIICLIRTLEQHKSVVSRLSTGLRHACHESSYRTGLYCTARNIIADKSVLVNNNTKTSICHLLLYYCCTLNVSVCALINIYFSFANQLYQI